MAPAEAPRAAPLRPPNARTHRPRCATPTSPAPAWRVPRWLRHRARTPGGHGHRAPGARGAGSVHPTASRRTIARHPGCARLASCLNASANGLRKRLHCERRHSAATAGNASPPVAVRRRCETHEQLEQPRQPVACAGRSLLHFSAEFASVAARGDNLGDSVVQRLQVVSCHSVRAGLHVFDHRLRHGHQRHAPPASAHSAGRRPKAPLRTGFSGVLPAGVWGLIGHGRINED